LDKVYRLLGTHKEGKEGERGRLKIAEEEAEQLRETKQDLENQLEALESQFEIVQNELDEMEKSRDQFKEQAERNATELTQKSQELVEQIAQLESVKQNYESALTGVGDLESQLFDKLRVERKAET